MNLENKGSWGPLCEFLAHDLAGFRVLALCNTLVTYFWKLTDMYKSFIAGIQKQEPSSGEMRYKDEVSTKQLGT